MTRVLYISTFQFSGSTLVSFLLNTHSDITTVGHTTGWNFTEHENFRCSCGQSLDKCPFYLAIAEAYRLERLDFDVRNFGTAYRITSHDRLNSILTARIPFVRNTSLELLRDRIVRSTPGFSGILERCDRSNLVFMRKALEYNDAAVFVDNSHDPFRFRQLARVDGLKLRHMHLIRDPRGVVLSCRKNSSWDLDMSMRLWLIRQSEIFRITAEGAKTLQLYYEDLCNAVDETLQEIFRFVDVSAQSYTGDFRAKEHHILGNDMRLTASNVKLDTRWQHELTSSELDRLRGIAADFASANPADPTSHVLSHYFQNL